MTNQEKQQIKEYFQIQPILDELNLTKEDIISQDKPDILIPNLNGLCIGIEVTTCVQSKILSKGKLNRARADVMINRACQYYKEHKKQDLSIYLLVALTEKAYNIGNTIKQQDLNKLITEEIDRHFKNDKYERYIDHDNEDDVKTYMSMATSGAFSYNYISSISTLKENTSTFDIAYSSAYCASPICTQAIESCIKEKETKLVDYKQDNRNQNINEYWLVINLPITEHTHFDNVEPSLFINSTYDRIYMTQMGSLKRLK